MDFVRQVGVQLYKAVQIWTILDEPALVADEPALVASLLAHSTPSN